MQISEPIALPVGELKPALTGLSKLINRSTTLPVLRAVRVNRDAGGWITLRGTTTDAFATARIEAPSPGEQSTILVPFGDLADVVKRCQAEDTITVADTGETIEITCPVGGQSLVHRAERIDPREFPEIPQTDAVSHAVEEGVRTALLEALQCSSTDETRYILQGAYLDVAQPTGHYIVGTDGRHLYSANTFRLPIKDSVVIPAHRFLHWKPFSADGEWRIRVFASGPDKNPWVSLCSRRWEFMARQVEGKFPNYRQVIPPDEAFKSKIRFDEEGCKFAIDALGKLPGADQQDKPVCIRLENGKAWFGSRPPAYVTWIELPGAKVSGADTLVTLNRTFLLKALSIGLTEIDLAGPCDPLRFRHSGRLIIAMPMRTVEPESNPNPQAAGQPAPQPAETAPQPPAQPESTMTETNGHQHNGHQTNGATKPLNNGAARSLTPTADKPAIEVAIEKLDTFKATFREALIGITEITGLLKQAIRDQKTGEKEIQQVRQTLRSLQGVKL